MSLRKSETARAVDATNQPSPNQFKPGLPELEIITTWKVTRGETVAIDAKEGQSIGRYIDYRIEQMSREIGDMTKSHELPVLDTLQINGLSKLFETLQG